MKRLVQSLMERLLPILSILVVLALLAGCGGGTAASPSPSATATPSGPNAAPVIDKVVAEWLNIERGKSGRIQCFAHDPDGDQLTYEWQTNRGSLTGDGDLVTFTAPNSYVDVTVIVTVRDGRGGVIGGGSAFSVVCCSHAQRNPEWVEPVE